MNPTKTGKVSSFLNSYRSKNTRKNYMHAIANFFKSVYDASVETGDLDVYAERYFNEKRDYEKDLQNFLISLDSFAPKTVRNRLVVAKTFLIENDVELSAKFWRKLSRKIKGSRALTLDKVPTNKGLRRIISHMPIQGKALYLTLSSSGMRIGEALKLNLKDIKLNETPAQIQIRAEISKTGNSRFAFISSEAKEALEEWFNVREAYLAAASGKSHKYDKSLEDTRIFPFEVTTAYMVWRHALSHAKKDERDNNTNRFRIHPHVLRKFFRTRLGAVIPVDVVEALMGHEEYLTEVYRKYSQEDLAKFYSQGESALLVFTETEEVSRLAVEVEERNRSLQTLANGLASENLELKSRMSKLELENTDLKGRIGKAEQKLGDIEKLLQELRSET